MKKRLFSMFLCLCIALTLAEPIIPTAKAATDALGFSFDKKIIANNPYPKTQTINNVTTYPCTLYVWQRIYDDHGISLPEWGDAKDWLAGAQGAGFETGTTPRPNSIVVYSGGTYGHVAYVTDVYGSKMTVDEGGRSKWASTTGGIGTSRDKINTVGEPDSDLGRYIVLGYIYVGTSSPFNPPETPKSITGTWKSTGPQWTAEISWDKPDGTTYYNVEYRTPKTNNQWKKDPDYSSGNRYISTGLKDYSYYRYRVQAGNAGGVSDWRYYTLEKPADVVKPAKPKNVSANWTVLSGMTARVSWPAVSGAEYYGIQYRRTKGGSWSSTVTVKSKTSYIFSELGMDSSYEFRVEAINAGGSSGWVECSLPTPADIVADLIEKEPAIAKPPVTVAAPAGVSCRWKSTGSNAEAELTWSTVSNVDYYEVGYKKDGGNWETIPVCILGPNTSHVFDKLDSSSSYSFRVRAAKSNVFSDWVECTLPAKPAEPAKLASPTGVSGSWTSIGPNWAARISWNAVSGATRYEVQYRTPKTGNAWKADPDYSSGTSYISTGLKDYDSYDYRVRAVNASGTSDWTEYKLEKNTTAPPVHGSYQNPSVYIQQADSDGCYIAAAAMVISNYRLQNGGSAITYAEAKSANGNSTFFNWGTFGKYGLKDVDLWTSANSGLSGSARAQMVITALGKNNYGAMLCFKGNGKSHAVVIIGYENGSIIVNDPARNGQGGERIKLTDCKYIRDNITGYVSQEQMLTYANSLTYFIANGSPSSDAGQKPTIENLQPPSAPSAPSGVSGSWTSTGPKWQAQISWNTVSGATYYEVQYRTPKTGNAWKADPDYSSGISYISTGLMDYNSYDYRVRACNSAGASAWTTYTLVKAIPAAPSAPASVSGSWTSRGPTWQARISWAAVSGATYYEVQYRTPKTGNAWRADPDYSSGTSYISTGLMDYNSYDYRVRAVNATGASAWTEYTLYK